MPFETRWNVRLVHIHPLHLYMLYYVTFFFNNYMYE